MSEAEWAPVETFRAAAPGLFAQQTAGRVHFQLSGLSNIRPNGSLALPLIVFIHGISAELTNWNYFVEYFVAKGRAVLTFDLYGRGYSDGSSRPNDLNLFLEQLTELLDSPEVKQRVSTDIVDIVGSSLGGGIGTAFSVRHASRVRKAVLMAPAGLGLPALGGVLQAVFRVPFLGRALLNLANLRGLEKNMQQSFANPADPAAVAFVRTATDRATALSQNHQGYVPSFISTVGHFPLSKMHDDFKALESRAASILVVWGDKDTVVDFSRDSPTLHALAPSVEIFVVPGSGHIDYLFIPSYRSILLPKLDTFLA